MLARWWRALLSFLGLLPPEPNPEEILHTLTQEMQARLSHMNRAVVEMMKTEVLVRNQVEQLEARAQSLEAQVIAAVRLGPQYESDARTLIAAMHQVREDLEDTREQHRAAQEAVAQASAMREDYVSAMETRCRQAMLAIQQNKQARIHEQLAELFSDLDSGVATEALEHTRDRVARRAAVAQARLDVASQTATLRLGALPRNVTTAHVDESLQEYKRQLGLL